VPAVIGMQAAIDGRAAALFSARFYRHIAEGEPVDIALLDERNTVSTQFDRDWCFAALTSRLHPDEILALDPPLTPERRDEIAAAIDSIRTFVDRQPQRRAIWRAVDPVACPHEARALLLIEGKDGVGKTQLVLRCAQACALGGCNVVHAKADKQQPQTFLAILRLIRDAVREAPLIFGQHLKKEAFARFDHVLSCALAGREAADVDQPGTVFQSDPGSDWPGAGGPPSLWRMSSSPSSAR
jgi:hypothetical protein